MHATLRTPVMTALADDERTVNKSSPVPCGPARSALPGEFADALPATTRLHEFEIVSVIGQGGFGIVYLAHDLMLDRRVAIKEYMPSALATRTHAMTVAVRSSRHAETFAAGLRSFVNEARLLAQFDHPSLLKVHRFWEAHNTAYMVMPYYAGITLATQLKQPGGPPNEAWLRGLLNPLLDALALMHAANCYHRDIAPDNILLLPDGAPLLLDFGAARRVISDMTQALTVILKTGYAPVEQYGAMPDLAQGAWTDLYALGSVLEFAITGRTPPQAVTRFLADKRQPLAVTAAGRYSEGFLRAIDRSLAVLPKDRPQSVAEMRELLAALAAPQLRAGARNDPAETTVAKVDVPRSPSPVVVLRKQNDPARAAPAVPAVPAKAAGPAARTSRRSLVMAGAMVIGLAAVVGELVWMATLPAPAQKSAPLEPAVTQAPAVLPQLAPALPQASPAPAPMDPAPSTLPATDSPAPSPPQPTTAAESDREPLPLTTPPTPPPRAADAARPQKHATARAVREPVSTPQSSQRIPNRQLPSARCADIIQRVSLGEPLSDAEKVNLKQECGP